MYGEEIVEVDKEKGWKLALELVSSMAPSLK